MGDDHVSSSDSDDNVVIKISHGIVVKMTTNIFTVIEKAASQTFTEIKRMMSNTFIHHSFIHSFSIRESAVVDMQIKITRSELR